MEDKKDIKDVTKETENQDIDKKEPVAADSQKTDTQSEEKKAAEKKPEVAKETADNKTEKKVTADTKSEEIKTEDKKQPESDKTEVTEKEADNKKADTEEKSKKETGNKKVDAEETAKKEVEDKKEEEKTSDKQKDADKTAPSKAVTQSKRIAEAAEAAKKQQESEKKDTKKAEKTGHKGLLIGLGCIVGILLIAYVAGIVYFSGHFYKDVTINGIEVFGMDKAGAKNILDTFYSNYTLTLNTIEDKQIVIDGKDISIQITLHDDFGKCLKEQKPYAWISNYFKHHEYQVSADVTWDEDQLQDVYKDMKILDSKYMVSPKDAYVGVEDGKFAIIDEVLGSTMKEKTFYHVVEESLATVQSDVDLVEKDCYELPKVYADDQELQGELKALDEYSDCDITLQLDDLTLEPGMELYEEVLEKKGDSYEISEALVKKYVAKLAKKYDTLETDRTFTTSFDDKKVKVYGSAFGYKMNQEETEQALLKALKAGKSAKIDVVFDEKGITLKGENDIGDTYIEVNLSEQRVIGYKNGKKIAEGDCVSGKEAAGNGTCIGLYKIQDKLSPTVLRGQKKPVTKTETKKNKKGKKVTKTTTTYEYEYESPVTYWIQFNGGIGLHDAAGWRSQYGGSIYYYSGSHGCVNLPLDLAKTLYENFELGDPVVVYFWDNENRK